MTTVIRGVKNALRNKSRTIAVCLVLAVAMGLTLSMLIANQAVSAKLTDLRNGLDTTVSVMPGFAPDEDEPALLTADQKAKIEALDHIDDVSASLSGMLNSPEPEEQSSGGNVQMAGAVGPTGDTDLVSGIDPEEVGAPKDMVFPIRLNGVSDNRDDMGTPFEVISGRALKDGDEYSALVSDQIAKANDLAVGDTFTAFGETFTVVGICATDEFDTVGVAMPADTVAELSDTDGYTGFTVDVDDVDNLESATEEIADLMGKNVEVRSNSETGLQAVAGLTTVADITWIGFLVSLLCATVVVVFTLAMTVRERRKEVGVIKAIGGTNRGVIAQFGVEAMTLVLIGGVLGLGLAAVSSNVMADVLIAGNIADDSGGGADAASAGGKTVAIGGDEMETAGDMVGDIAANIGFETLGLGFLVVLAIALLGSALPAWLIARVRPAEVLRGE